MKKIYAVIMAGGQGERYWPLTHKNFPKYQIKLDGKYSLLQKTYERLSKVYSKERVFIVTTRDHLGMIFQELPRLKKSHVFVEPARKNTAPAILLSSSMIQRRFGEDAVVSFYPADHLIQNESLFRKTIENAARLASKEEALVTIGIKPTFPATGYGYIHAGRRLRGFADAYRVARFTEKPSYRVACRYLKKGGYYWNGGIFTWRAGVFLKTLKNFSPEFYNAFDLSSVEASYRRLPRLSIDYALLEKAGNMAVIRTAMDWCDMGSWDMFLEKARRDHNKNFVHGKAHGREFRDSLILNYGKNPLITLGISGLIVVQTERGTLICKRGRSEEAALLAKDRG